MAEQSRLTLNNRSLGMSADEYTGGSFYYWENINVRENGKVIKSSSQLSQSVMNVRTNWYATAWMFWDNNRYILSADGYFEEYFQYNGMYQSVDTTWWALYRKSSWGYVNGIQIWTSYLCVSTATIDRFITPEIMFVSWTADASNIITNKNLTSNTDWTVWSGWTTWVNGAVHTTGTATIEQTLVSPDWTKKHRIAVMVRYHTAGTVQVRLREWSTNTILGTISTSSDMWSVFYVDNDTALWTAINLLPSNDFNGTVSAVMLSPYDSNLFKPDSIAITSATKHPVIYYQGDLYVWSGATIDVINIVDRWVRQLNVIDNNYTIVWFTQIWSQVIIWATDGNNSKQYFWNSVDEVASECIDYKWLVIVWVDNDWVDNYVVTKAGNDSKLFMTSWYSKMLVASSLNSNGYWYTADTKAYKIQTRNNFNCNYSNIVCYDWKVAIPSNYWVYTYGTETPWQKWSLAKTWRIPTINIYGMSNLSWLWLCVSYKQSITWWDEQKPWTYTYNLASIEDQWAYYGRNEWMLVTNPIVWDNLSSDKIINKLNIWYTLYKPQDYIDIYIKANDKYYWTFWVSWVTTTPTMWAIYTIYGSTFTVINTDITGWVGTISCSSKSTDWYNIYGDSTTNVLTKTSGTGDSTITSSDYDNFIKIKRIQVSEYTVGSELIFSWTFIEAQAPNRSKIQLKFTWYWYASYYSPEISDISVLADIVNNDA